MWNFDSLPNDDARRILWRFADRDDSQMLVRSVRAVARGPVARLVQQGARKTHEWIPAKQELLRACDGFTEGPKNLAQALVTFELAWVDAGAVEILEAVVRRSRVAAGITAAARLLSAVEPVIRYQRERFRGSSTTGSGTPRYDLGLQMKEDAVNRLLEVWTGGESCASLGFEAARLLERLDPVLESVANVLCLACRVWSIHHAPRLMRKAVSLMGGSGVTEDCPGFVGYKWIEPQMDAIAEGPQGAPRRQLGVAMADQLFLAQFRAWMRELEAVAATHPSIGAGALAIAMEVWLWTLQRLQHLSLGWQGAVTLALADALCGILASRAQILDVIELLTKSPSHATFLSDLCHVQAVNVTGEVGRVCAELVHGYGETFSDMQVLLDTALAGSVSVRDRALEAVIRVRIPEAPDYPA
jgi:hypothetical protein